MKNGLYLSTEKEKDSVYHQMRNPSQCINQDSIHRSSCFVFDGIWKLSFIMSYCNIERHLLPATWVVKQSITPKGSCFGKQERCYSPARQFKDTLCKTIPLKNKIITKGSSSTSSMCTRFNIYIFSFLFVWI